MSTHTLAGQAGRLRSVLRGLGFGGLGFRGLGFSVPPSLVPFKHTTNEPRLLIPRHRSTVPASKCYLYAPPTVGPASLASRRTPETNEEAFMIRKRLWGIDCQSDNREP